MARAYTQPVAEHDPLRMSYAEWQGWYGGDDLNRGEWVNGEVVPFMPPLLSHVDIVDFLFFLIGNYVRRRRLGRVYSESVELWLPASQSARMPDLVYLSHRHRARQTAHRLEGYADLVIEVVSQESATRDQRVKFAEYQTAGIPEYWIIDPRRRRQTVHLYVLDANGSYHEAPPDETGRLQSRAITGLWIDPEWLWQDPMPDPDDLLDELMPESGR